MLFNLGFTWGFFTLNTSHIRISPKSHAHTHRTHSMTRHATPRPKNAADTLRPSKKAGQLSRTIPFPPQEQGEYQRPLPHPPHRTGRAHHHRRPETHAAHLSADRSPGVLDPQAAGGGWSKARIRRRPPL